MIDITNKEPVYHQGAILRSGISASYLWHRWNGLHLQSQWLRQCHPSRRGSAHLPDVRMGME